VSIFAVWLATSLSRAIRSLVQRSVIDRLSGSYSTLGTLQSDSDVEHTKREESFARETNINITSDCSLPNNMALPLQSGIEALLLRCQSKIIEENF